MALGIKVGDKIDMKEKRTGTTSGGKQWCMVNVKAETGYDSITVWVRNAQLASNFLTGEVTEIHSVTLKNVRGKKDPSKWYKAYECEVTVKSVEAEQKQNAQAVNTFDSFMPMPDDLSDDSLPFN